MMALQPTSEQPQLATLLTTTIENIPESFQPFVSPLLHPTGRVFRQSLYTVFSVGSYDQTSLVSELLAIAGSLNPPFFKPDAPSVSEIAIHHAKVYAGQYLALYATQQLDELGATKERILTPINNFWVGHVKRLELNFNQRERISGYLRDVKARDGQLARIASLLGALTSHQPEVVCDVAEELGAALGTAVAILIDVKQTTQLSSFRNQLMTGHYGLPLLFGFENEPNFFTALFQQPHKPSDDQIQTAQALALQTGRKPAVDMAVELINQSKLDCMTLPEGEVQNRLSTFLDNLMAYATNM